MEFLYSTRNPSVPTAYSRLDAMHTRCEILLPYLPEDEARALVDAVWERVQEADRRYNRFLPGSVLAEVNRKAAGEAVEVDEELFMVLQLCETFRKATSGYFDVTAGSRVPDRALLLAILLNIGCIIYYHTPFYEVFTQIGYTVVIALGFYVIWTAIRLIAWLFRKKK